MKAGDPGRAKIEVELLFCRGKAPESRKKNLEKVPSKLKTNKQKPKPQFYNNFGNENIFCGFDFLTRQSGTCRQIIPHRHRQPLSPCYRVASPSQSKKANINPTAVPQNPLWFLPKLCLSYPQQPKSSSPNGSFAQQWKTGGGGRNPLHPHFSRAMSAILP